MEQFRLFPELSLSNLVSQSVGQVGIGTYILAIIFALALVVLLMIVSMCLIFEKAGRKWWEAVIPFYNIYVATIIVGVPWWVIFGFFVPFLNWVVPVYINYHLSKRFGFDVLFTLGLVFLPFIFLPILAFGGALYTQPTPKTTA